MSRGGPIGPTWNRPRPDRAAARRVAAGGPGRQAEGGPAGEGRGGGGGEGDGREGDGPCLRVSRRRGGGGGCRRARARVQRPPLPRRPGALRRHGADLSPAADDTNGRPNASTPFTW